MTEYVYLTRHTGNWVLQDGKSGTSFYIVAVKSNNCKPQVFKCDKPVYDSLASLKNGEKINLMFDERQVVCNINKVSV